MAFFIVIIFGFLALGFMGTQSPPDPVNSTQAYNIYQNQTAVIDIAFSGLSGVQLLMILAMIMAAAWMIIKSIT